MSVTVEFWVCPTPSCGNYYGASSVKGVNLAAALNYRLVLGEARRGTDSPSKATHSRARCPDCKARGGAVERVLKRVVVPI